jgi:phage-related protein
MLHKTFTPSQTMFSKRLTEAYINNLGDVKAEPVLKITNTSGEIPQGGDCAVTIHNHTNGKRIEYSYPLQPGEEVVIDIPKRRMTNNKGESILHTLSDDSFLSDFYLDKRLNHISVTAGGLSHISAACTFSNKYIEAVI